MRLGSKIVLAFLFLAVGSTVFAQLGMELKSNQTTYMIHEPVYLQVSLRNDTGQALVFGENEKLRGKLFLEMRDALALNTPLSQGTVVSGEFPLYGCVIKAGEYRRLVLRFDSVMNLKKAGFYRIYAYISHPLLKNKYRSNDIKIELTEGSVMKRFSVGVPKLTNEKEQIEERTYTLRSLIDRGMKFFYVVLKDEKKTYQVVRVGSDLGIENPRCETDMMSRLHVLVNISAKVFKYYVIDISGRVENCSYSKIGSTIPTLIREPSGRVYVTGGEPASAGVDYKVEKPML